MHTSTLKLFKFFLPVGLIVLIELLALFPPAALAQCPTFTGDESFTSGITRFQNPNAQLWFNDGLWWGVFSDMNVGIYFYSMTPGGIVKGPIVDGNTLGSPDALWDGTNLYVLVWKSLALATFYKYSYNSVTKTYTLLSGFPVNLALSGASPPAVLEKDSNGKLWATYTSTNGGGSDGKVRVIWTTSADHTAWDTTGNVLETGLNPLNMEVADIVAFGGNKIGVVWSNYPNKQIAFRYHVDGDPETNWSVKEIIDSGNGPSNFPGGSVADDHLNMAAAPDGRIFLVAKDNDNDGSIANAHVGRLWLYIRTTAGVWGQKTLVQPDPSQIATRPVLALDTTHSVAYVVYHDETLPGRSSTGRNFITYSPMNNPIFDFPCVLTPTPSSNPVSTKQNVTSATGLMIASSTGQTSSNEIVFRGVDLSLNPIPNPTSLSPSSAIKGGSAFTLTVNGTGFVSNSVVQWNGVDRPTIFLNSTQLTANITAADISAAGTAAVTVFNPAPGGGVSGSLNFAIDNPVPTLNSISPTTKIAGDAAFVLTANGASFQSNSSVRVNGTDRPTTFVNSTQLTAQLTAADVQIAGTVPITVFNPGPGGGTSGTVNLAVNNPVPTVSNISPTTKIAGDAAFTLTVNGSGYVNGSVVRFNGSNRTTSFVSGTQLAAQIAAADVASAGTFAIVVFNAAPGGGTSNAVNLAVNNPVPTLTSISPTSKTAGDAAFTLTVNGGSYINGSVVRFNGNDRTTTFVNSGQLTAQITAADVQTAGSFPITVFNPAPGGGLSSLVNLTVNPGGNPIPVLTSLNPTSSIAGGAAFTLTVNGSSLIATSVVRWNGVDRSTTFVNSGQVTAQILAADIATAGSANVTVFNPAPGGGLSNSLSFTINPPGGCVGYEADVAPRPNGSNNGSITISDWVQTGRFSAGLDTPNPGCEFQRADSAPRGTGGSTLGNGAITVSDWVQAGRYAAGLDPVTPVGGPTAPPVAPPEPQSNNAAYINVAADRALRAVGNPLNPGQAAAVKIELDSLGDENALGFSVTFDSSKLTFVSATLGSDGSGVTLNVNPGQASAGRVGIAMAQPAGQSFTAGTRHLLTLNFNVAANASGATTIGFGDQPVAREIADANVNILTASYSAATLNINSTGPSSTLQFSAANFSVGEGAGSATITVSRTGDTSGEATVDYGINNMFSSAPCDAVDGLAKQNCDYTITKGTLHFATGETARTFDVLIVEDGYVEGNETLDLQLSNASGASIGGINTATLTILDNDTAPPTTNLIDGPGVFVRQHYLDFLNREPDSGGLSYWTGQIAQCGTDTTCIHNQRIGVSGAFFVELEFQKTGYVVYRIHKAAYGARPLYSQFMPDRSQLIGGQQLPATTAAFANSFVLRPEFKTAYPDSMTATEFVNKLFDTAALMNSAAQRQQAINELSGGGKSRAQVLLDVIEIPEFKEREYNPSFVLMQYFGYLRRNPDPSGFDFWLDIVNNREPNNYRGMICAFITSSEYQQRFSSVVTRSNAQCGP